MKNEPVAWMAFDKSGASLQCKDEFCIPLYTHPVKELTIHEDIVYGLAYKYEENMDSFGTRIGIPKEDIIDFARAILRKAQEK